MSDLFVGVDMAKADFVGACPARGSDVDGDE
jgi:hypothetical protein